MSDIVIYKTENGAVSVKLAQETVWLSQAQMIALFDRDQSVISRHIRNVFNPDCSLGVESSQNQGVVGRVLTRHIGLKPDLRPNGLSGFITPPGPSWIWLKVDSWRSSA
ncbi:MAG: hypothetical protein Q8O38_15340 [Sulfurimicrobium sp.]|nr:hypothetical protein [Sulfurimicrobium sp.]